MALTITLQLRQRSESCCKLGTEVRPTIAMTMRRISDSFSRRRSLVDGRMWRALGGRVGTAHGAGSGIQDAEANELDEPDELDEGVEGDAGEPNPGAAWWVKCRLAARTAGM